MNSETLQSMRPKQHPNQESRSFHIHITVQSVDQETIHRMTTTIERMLWNHAEMWQWLFSLLKTQTIRRGWILHVQLYIQNPKKVRNAIDNIRKKHIASCFPDGMKIDKQRKLVVTASPIDPFDDSVFSKIPSVWSQSPWDLIYAGPCAAAGHEARLARWEGSRFQLTFPN